MKTVLVLAAVILGLSGCKKGESPVDVIPKALCSFEDIAVMTVSSSIATYAQCANPPGIMLMVRGWAKAMDICDKADQAKKRKKDKELAEAGGGMSTKGAIGDVVCAPMLSALSFGLLMQLPADAQCAGPVDMEKVKADLLAKCLSAI